MDINWKNICFELRDCQKRRSLEKEYQGVIKGIFRYSLQWWNNVVAEESINIGSANSIRPDFVLYNEGVQQVIIEAKEPNHKQNERNREQLFSYMRQKKVDYGLYIGEFIQLYYDNPKDKEDPCVIFTLDFDETSKFGADFVRLFNRPSYNIEALQTYCQERLSEIEKEKKIEEIRNRLLAAEGGQILLGLLKEKLVSDGYGADDVQYILEDINIIVNNVRLKSALQLVESTEIRQTKEKSNKRWQKFTINGKGSFSKNGCIYEVIKQWMQITPKTYFEIQSIVNKRVPHLIVSEEEFERKKRESAQTEKEFEARWHKPLISADGRMFRISTQIGDNCPIDFTKDIVPLAASLGYKIEQI